MRRGWSLAGKLLAAGALAGWTAGAFWVFSFSYSSSFFHYSPHSRIPPFAAAVLGAVLIPVSAAIQWLRVRRSLTSPLRAWFAHMAGAAGAVVPLVAVAATLRYLPDPWRPSADDSMGIGIDFMILCGVALLSVVVTGVAFAIESRFDRKRSSRSAADVG